MSTTPFELRLSQQAREHLERCLELLGPLPAQHHHEAWRDPVVRALPDAAPEARQAWAEAERLWWRLATARTRPWIFAQARFFHRSVATRYQIEDLVSAGQIGAYFAAQRWAPGAVASWSTFATLGIRQQIQLSLRSGATEVVRLPELKRTAGWRIYRELRDLERQGLPLDLEIVAGRCGLSRDVVEARTRRPGSPPARSDNP